ncbi:translation initiation factor [Spirulina subsalsa FACHB-351]|uniref:Translation initiation factor n=1 Tax=Spirulina subsalsa FACHB-351 TaxID=234711 RepID=A0ABT3L534_9CYAN|nr:translation initiation factor [Spirulina subsalsa]MCW6036633.1 translation initiation factor [Spirulina subsalsa FACHB-351]
MSAKKRIVYQEFGSTSGNPPPSTLNTERPDLPSHQQNLFIQASRKGRKGKTVTVISGFQCKATTLADLLKELKTKCGTGGTVKENTLEIQGDHKQKLLALLTEMGYRAKISGG